MLAVMRPFLHDPIGVAADPDVVLAVDETAMDRFGHLLRIAPCVHDVPVGIIFDDDRRGLLADSLLHRREIGPVHAEHVILAIDADAADRPCHPSIGQGFRPIGIDDEARDFAVRGAGGPVEKHENNRGADQAREHGRHASRPDFERKRRDRRASSTWPSNSSRMARRTSAPGPPNAHEDQPAKSITVTGGLRTTCVWMESSSRGAKRRGDPGVAGRRRSLDCFAIARPEGRASFDALWLAMPILGRPNASCFNPSTWPDLPSTRSTERLRPACR